MVLCHEAAHIAAYHLYGRNARPHGAEWAALVRAAGFSPASSFHSSQPTEREAALRRRPRHPSTRLVAHVCPVCQTERLARRVVRGWRCAECVAAGLDGHLDTSVAAAST